MPKQGRQAVRSTLTDSQLRAGYQEGGSIWSSIWSGLKKAAKFAKKHHLLSRGLSFGSKYLPGPWAAAAKTGSKVAQQLGNGHGRAPKSITKAQYDCIRAGHCRPLQSGGLSLALGRTRGFPGVKNLTAAQVRALINRMGRHMSGGGIRLSGGKCSAYYNGKGLSHGTIGAGNVGWGLHPAGGGLKLAGTGTRKGMRRKTARKAYEGGKKSSFNPILNVRPHRRRY